MQLQHLILSLFSPEDIIIGLVAVKSIISVISPLMSSCIPAELRDLLYDVLSQCVAGLLEEQDVAAFFTKLAATCVRSPCTNIIYSVFSCTGKPLNKDTEGGIILCPS